MKPDLVLTEDDKKKRFKKFLKKKESEIGSGPVSGSPRWDAAPSSPPSPQSQVKFPNFMTNTFQNNLQLLFAQGAAGRVNLLNANNRLSPPSPSPARSPVQTFGTSPFTMIGSEYSTSPPSLSPIRDVEAARFLKSRGWFSPPGMASPNLGTRYSVSPYNHTELFMRPLKEEAEAQDFSLSLRRNEERQSVITFPRMIKPEPGLFQEFVKPQLVEPFTEQESAELCPENLSLKREAPEEGEEDREGGHYVHKKFRTTVDKSEEEESLARAQLSRRSVIMHASHARVWEIVSITQLYNDSLFLPDRWFYLGCRGDFDIVRNFILIKLIMIINVFFIAAVTFFICLRINCHQSKMAWYIIHYLQNKIEKSEK